MLAYLNPFHPRPACYEPIIGRLCAANLCLDQAMQELPRILKGA